LSFVLLKKIANVAKSCEKKIIHSDHPRAGLGQLLTAMRLPTNPELVSTKENFMLEIQAEKVQELRRARGFGRSKLAKISGLTERQVSRLEGALPWRGTLTSDMILRLAAALQVQPEILVGDQPLTELDRAAAPKASSCSCCS